MSFRLAYLAIWAMALAVIFISLSSGDITRRFEISAINRYELFILFLYVSTVCTVLKSGDEIIRSKEKSAVEDDEAKSSDFSFDEKLLILMPSLAVVLIVFGTA